jgi:hypothetical protein
VADPPRQPVVPLGKGLLQPLHDPGELQPVRRLNVKPQPVILQAQPQNLEIEPALDFKEDPGKKHQGPIQAEERFPVVDAGTDLVPHPLFQLA